MKKLFFTVYVASILGYSAIARAEFSLPIYQPTQYLTKAIIHDVALASDMLRVRVTGTVPNSCSADPFATLVEDPRDARVLVLKMSTPIVTKGCMDQVREYQTIVDIPAAARLAGLRLHADQDYMIVAEGTDFKVMVSGSDLQSVNF